MVRIKNNEESYGDGKNQVNLIETTKPMKNRSILQFLDDGHNKYLKKKIQTNYEIHDNFIIT